MVPLALLLLARPGLAAGEARFVAPVYAAGPGGLALSDGGGFLAVNAYYAQPTLEEEARAVRAPRPAKTNRSTLFVYDAALGKTTRVGALEVGQEFVSSMDWAGESGILAVRTLAEGLGRVRLFRIDVRSGTSATLVDVPKETDVHAWAAPRSATVAYRIGRPGGGWQAFLVRRDGRTVPLARGPAPAMLTGWTERGEPIFEDFEGGDEEFAYSVEDGAPHPTSPTTRRLGRLPQSEIRLVEGNGELAARLAAQSVRLCADAYPGAILARSGAAAAYAGDGGVFYKRLYLP